MRLFLEGLQEYTRALILGTKIPESRYAYRYQRIIRMASVYGEKHILPIAGGYEDQNPLLMLAFDYVEEVRRQHAPRD